MKLRNQANKNMGLPKMVFSKWYKWEDMKLIENADSPGVYVLAKFKHTPIGKTNLLKDIIYVGETCGQTLKKRWYQFNNSAFLSKPGHSGGYTYHSTYGDDGSDLYVAALPISDMSQALRHLFIRFVERKILLEFAIENGKQPILNRK